MRNGEYDSAAPYPGLPSFAIITGLKGPIRDSVRFGGGTASPRASLSSYDRTGRAMPVFFYFV